MDRDEDSIGGIEKPMAPTQQLFLLSIVMDFLAVAASLIIGWWFAVGILVYIVFSRLYSYRKIRLKQYPVIGYLTVIVNQGALVFLLVLLGASNDVAIEIPWLGVVSAAFLIGGFYPITQIYQHKSDAKDGVTTISMLLGKKGTFVFCAVMYTVALAMLFLYFTTENEQHLFWLLQLFFVPVIIYFLRWAQLVWKVEDKADFKHTMRMNWLASTCTAMAFITIIIVQHIG
jgi:1,4-dihydroxy-2-naphthoate octaprenyltransferase